MSSSLIRLTVQHGRDLPEARQRLELAVAEIQGRFGAFVQRTEWSEDRNQVKMFGPGMEVELRVDDRDVHFTGDIPFVGKLLGSPLLKGLKGVVEDKFQKRLK